MPEENAEHQEGTEGGAAGNGNEGQQNQEGAGEQTPEEKAATEAATADATAKAAADEAAAKKAQEDEEPKISQRKSTKDYIIERKDRKIAKLQTQQNKDDGDDNSGASDEGDDDGVNPDDEKLITEVVLKKFAPIIEKNLQAEDETELQEFLAKPENADFKAYEARARKFMQHPSRRMLPISSIFYEVAGPDLIKIGAQRQKSADEEAARSNAGGGSARGAEGVKTDYTAMSNEEFAKEREKVRLKRAN